MQRQTGRRAITIIRRKGSGAMVLTQKRKEGPSGTELLTLLFAMAKTKVTDKTLLSEEKNL
jgi:hypothetical protein